MKIEIENYRGIESATVELAPIAIVGGANAAGKSSIAQAAAAALTGTPTPIPGVTKSGAGVLVRSGTGGGAVKVSRDADAVTVNWPAGKVKSEGTPPTASLYAVGLKSLADLDNKERAAELISMMKANPDQADLARALKDVLDDESMKKLWEVIQRDGWDTRHKTAKETGARLKGQWEEATGERYGEQKAAQWIPRDWSPELSGASEETLSGVLAQEKEGLEATIAGSAVDAAEVERLRNEIAAPCPDVGDLEKAHEDARKAAQIARGELAAMTVPGSPEQTQPCPHCGTALLVRGGKLAIPSAEKSPYDDAVYRAKYDQKRGDVDRLNKAASDAADALVNARTAHARRRDAEKKLAELETRPAADGGGDIDKARESVKRAEERLRAFKAKARADDLAQSIGINQAVVAVLAPDGLRQEKLKTALDGFNKELALLCEKAQWGRVEISPDLEFSYARRPWVILSESERYRVRVTLQVAIANGDGSEAVIFDGADILDRQGRNGLACLAQVADCPALICMTLKDPSELPDVDAAGIGHAYWIADARSQPRAESLAK